ncbi:molybdopterin-dependent oxidoreductase [Flavonifractor plautii]|nr:molybdopterin-dependent oxidoreductase [Flavonifractor plautii]
MACFSYKTGVYPISLETASARLVLNQDGTVQLHLGATEIGQGATPCSPRWPPRPSAFPPRTYILSPSRTPTQPL